MRASSWVILALGLSGPAFYGLLYFAEWFLTKACYWWKYRRPSVLKRQRYFTAVLQETYAVTAALEPRWEPQDWEFYTFAPSEIRWALDEAKFKECPECRIESDTSPLCGSCLNNRHLIAVLQRELRKRIPPRK